MSGLKGDNPVEQLREKLARDARWRVRERYFGLRIVPVLLVWALLMAAGRGQGRSSTSMASGRGMVSPRSAWLIQAAMLA